MAASANNEANADQYNRPTESRSIDDKDMICREGKSAVKDSGCKRVGP